MAYDFPGGSRHRDGIPHRARRYLHVRYVHKHMTWWARNHDRFALACGKLRTGGRSLQSLRLRRSRRSGGRVAMPVIIEDEVPVGR